MAGNADPLAPGKPDDAALLELGRMTWAAISLEDVVYGMGDALGLDTAELADMPVSASIRRELEVLNGWPGSEIRDDASKWFIAARQALEARNSVLHAVPGIWVTIGDDHALTPHGPVLEDLGRKGRPYQGRWLTEDGLRPVRLQLEEARAEWVEIFLALVEEHKRNRTTT
jgi:hypothetical protein